MDFKGRDWTVQEWNILAQHVSALSTGKVRRLKRQLNRHWKKDSPVHLQESQLRCWFQQLPKGAKRLMKALGIALAEAHQVITIASASQTPLKESVKGQRAKETSTVLKNGILEDGITADPMERFIPEGTGVTRAITAEKFVTPTRSSPSSRKNNRRREPKRSSPHSGKQSNVIEETLRRKQMLDRMAQHSLQSTFSGLSRRTVNEPTTGTSPLIRAPQGNQRQNNQLCCVSCGEEGGLPCSRCRRYLHELCNGPFIKPQSPADAFCLACRNYLGLVSADPDMIGSESTPISQRSTESELGSDLDSFIVSDSKEEEEEKKQSIVISDSTPIKQTRRRR